MIRRVVRVHCMYPFRDLFPGIDTYSSRAVVAAKPDDIVVLRDEYRQYLDDLGGLGLGAYRYLHVPGDGCMITNMLQHGKCIDELRKEAKRCRLVAQPFIMSKPMNELLAAVPDLELAASRFNLAEDMNDKATCHGLFQGLNIECSPGGVCVTANDIERMARDLRAKGVRKIVLKDPSPYVASGKSKLGEMRADGSDQQFALGLMSLKASHQQFRGKKRVILEQWWESVQSSPSVVGNITTTGKTELIAMTEQLMEDDDKTEYRGSIISAGSHQVHADDLPEMFRIYQLVANKLAKRGWVGVFGIDFIIVVHQGKRLVIPTEINGRYTGSMYLVNIMRRLSVEHWLGYSSNIRLPVGTTYPCLKAAIELVEDREKARIIPLNIGPLALGKAMIAVLVQPHVKDGVAYAEGIRMQIQDAFSMSRYTYQLTA